jgi:hypothetical protein
MTDILGKTLKLDDNVIFIAPNYRMLVQGKIINFTEKNVRISYVNTWNYSGMVCDILQSPKQLVKVEL